MADLDEKHSVANVLSIKNPLKSAPKMDWSQYEEVEGSTGLILMKATPQVSFECILVAVLVFRY